MKKIKTSRAFKIAFIFLFIATSVFSQDEDVTSVNDSACNNPSGINPKDPNNPNNSGVFGERIYPARWLPSIASSSDDVNNAGTASITRMLDDRTCAYNYTQGSFNFGDGSKNYGRYRIAANSNPQNSRLQPRIERASPGINENLNPGTRVVLDGVAVIRRVGYVNASSNQNGTYIAQAKGKFEGETKDPAIALILVKPTSSSQNRFRFYLERISGSTRCADNSCRVLQDLEFEVNRDTPVRVVLKNEFIKAGDGTLRHRIRTELTNLDTNTGITDNFNVQEPERATDIKVRFGAYRVWGGEADIFWREGVSLTNTINTTPATNNNSQDWSDLSDGWYKIVPKSNQNKVLTVDIQNANNLVQWPDQATDNQKFYVRRDGDYYELKSGAFPSTGSEAKSIDLNGWQTGNGTNISAYNDSNTDNQRWKFADGSNNFISIRSKLNTNKGLAILGNEVNTDRASIILWDYFPNNNHLFKFVPTSAPGSSGGNTTSCTNPTASVASKGSTNINVQWNNVGASSYYIYLKQEGGNWQLQESNINGTALNITGLSTNTRYYIDVWARCSSGNKKSNTLNVVTNSSGSSGGTNSNSTNLLSNKLYLSNFNSGIFNNDVDSWGGQKAVDGNGSTRWASAPNGSDPDFIGWDLGANYNISQMKVKWETARGIDFGFVYYNNGTWYYMNNISGNNSSENSANVDVNARYIGIYITRGYVGHSSAWEVEAYGYQAKSASKSNNIISAIPVDGNFSKIALEEKEITVFPNPVNADSFTINLKGMESANITITNVLGKVVYKTTTKESVLKINKNNNFTTGMYIVSVKDENNNVFRSKLLVK